MGKINDIFASQGITESNPTKSNDDGMNKAMHLASRDFNGLCFVNLVEFDSLYGHRNNVDGYTEALNSFDRFLGSFLNRLRDDDVLIITADHGCDPKTESTDHSREYIPMLFYSNSLPSVDLGTRHGFSDVGKTVLDIFGVENNLNGESFLGAIYKEKQ